MLGTLGTTGRRVDGLQVPDVFPILHELLQAHADLLKPPS